MRTETKITANIDDVQLGYWGATGCKVLVPNAIDKSTRTISLEDAATHFECSEKLLALLVKVVNNITQAVGDDLKDTWQRLDDLDQAR